jgi:hypothetical protein
LRRDYPAPRLTHRFVLILAQIQQAVHERALQVGKLCKVLGHHGDKERARVVVDVLREIEQRLCKLALLRVSLRPG